jgi:hypothetical protein
MSAWVVSEGHIDTLVMGLVVHGLVGPGEDRAAVGQMLWDENVRSVNHRYDEQDEAEPYTFRPIEVVLEPYGLLKQVKCYQYQSCEHPEWEGSEAMRLTDGLVRAVLDRTGERRHRGKIERLEWNDPAAYWNHPAYDAAPWGVVSPAEIGAAVACRTA